MMLKDKQGRTVLMREVRDGKNYRTGYALWARDGLTMTPVDEAIISAGDDIFLTDQQIGVGLANAGFPNVKYAHESRWGRQEVHVETDSHWSGGCFPFGGRVGQRQQTFSIEGRSVDQGTFEKLHNALNDLNAYNGLRDNIARLQKGVSMSLQKAMELIGEGKTVTAESLGKGCAVGEDRPRLLPGDTVKIKMKGKDVFGVIKSLKSTITILRQDGKKMTCPFDRVEKSDHEGHNEELAAQVEPTILQNFEYVVKAGTTRIFRAKLERGDFTFPMFPNTNKWGQTENQTSREGIMSCPCPVCGWRMADINDSGEFICCYCRIQGNVITRSETEVALLMSRVPGKNRFAIKESRCCGNCGRFEFETGREGKRTTGYCKTANQCLQAFNVCDMWFPRAITRYDSNLRQHTTNLHYGVADNRNTDRNDIKDTVYTEADHKLEIARADKAKVAYANAYQRFYKSLREVAATAPLVEAMTPELTEHWQKVLDDPC